ncbi:hypothetical protein J2S05_003424 [Alkalicoccobacillus murimartini]|uniref:Uncharacterized protein n=1 Tax=Alkalicoccobacillus murimartini TaxID=171685 RepID=A0ABT9YL53_9BACI|nr:hypothetical protein [Alkalicoccobacillus murimartini]
MEIEYIRGNHTNQNRKLLKRISSKIISKISIIIPSKRWIIIVVVVVVVVVVFIVRHKGTTTRLDKRK